MYSEEILKNLLSNSNIKMFCLALYTYKMGDINTPRKNIWVSRKILLKKADLLDRTKPKLSALGVNSLVKIRSDKIFHIPQVDFKCKISKKNLNFLIKNLKEMGQNKGFVVQTIRSYHFYGHKLMNNRSWIIFMGRLLRLNGYRSRHLKKVTDQRWIGASLIRGAGTLRISSSYNKSSIPKIVYRLN